MDICCPHCKVALVEETVIREIAGENHPIKVMVCPGCQFECGTIAQTAEIQKILLNE